MNLRPGPFRSRPYRPDDHPSPIPLTALAPGDTP